ncbi:hypothetical protein AMK16_22600 [Streptomyces sp. CB00455]|nr:hypothetical protein AMK16_22600 [Streptomyces sp. CB00455]
MDAAAPGSVDPSGRRGKELVGRRVLETYPAVAGSALWEGCLDALTTGTVHEGAPFPCEEAVAAGPRRSAFSVRAARLGGRLIVSWTRHDREEREEREPQDARLPGAPARADRSPAAAADRPGQEPDDPRSAESALLESERTVLVERGKLQAERTLAARLQHALLPTPERSLELAGLHVDIAYVPSDAGVNVGGDWYSAIELPDRSALFVVGDVAGHGLDAVGTMAQLRFTAKGMTITGSALPDVLGRLNSLLLHTASEPCGATATMIMARYQPWDHRMTWVRAGHLPPLLIRRGEARFLPQPQGRLLGASFTSAYEQEMIGLEAGDHLVLYTDGLVEEPGESIDTGLARLAETARALVAEGRADTLARTLAAQRQGNRDDICVLDIHVPGSGGAP